MTLLSMDTHVADSEEGSRAMSLTQPFGAFVLHAPPGGAGNWVFPGPQAHETCPRGVTDAGAGCRGKFPGLISPPPLSLC